MKRTNEQKTRLQMLSLAMIPLLTSLACSTSTPQRQIVVVPEAPKVDPWPAGLGRLEPERLKTCMTPAQAREVGKRLAQLEEMPERCEVRIRATAKRCAANCTREISEERLDAERTSIPRWRSALRVTGISSVVGVLAYLAGFVTGRVTKK